MRSVVVLPAPLGPRNPVMRPGSTVNVRSSTAVRSPNRFVSRSTSMRPLPLAVVIICHPLRRLYWS